jgi:hypothetical protein
MLKTHYWKDTPTGGRVPCGSYSGKSTPIIANVTCKRCLTFSSAHSEPLDRQHLDGLPAYAYVVVEQLKPVRVVLTEAIALVTEYLQPHGLVSSLSTSSYYKLPIG